MTYLSGKFKKKKNYTKYVVYAGLLFVVVFFWPQIKKMVYPVAEPLVVTYATTRGSFFSFPEFFRTYVSSHKTLVARQKELEVEIERLENLVAEKDAFIRETVSSASSTTGERGASPLVMYPLMQDMTRLYSTVILSKGYKDGVIPDTIVYIRGNQAVCIIKEVYPASSLCTLLASSGIETEGVTSSSSITLTLVGRGGHYIANIPRETPVTQGEIVYLRSNPKMILGKVTFVSNNDQDTSWHVFVEGAYNPVTSSIFYAQPQ